MPYNQLSFSVNFLDMPHLSSDLGQVQRAQVLVWVDGMRLNQLPFDALACFGQGTMPGFVHLFKTPDQPNMAQDPGLLEPVRIQSAPGWVSWKFSPLMGAGMRNLLIKPAGPSGELLFDARQYTQALDDLISLLMEKEKTEDLRLLMCCEPKESAHTPLALRVLFHKEDADFWFKLIQDHADTLGRFSREEVVVTLLHDVTLSISPVQVLHVHAEQLASRRGTKVRKPGESVESYQRRILFDELVPLCMREGSALLDISRELGWEEVEPLVQTLSEPYLERPDLDWRGLPLEVLETAWTKAPRMLRKFGT